MSKLVNAFKKSCPLVALETADPARSIAEVIAQVPHSGVLVWDSAEGLQVPPQANRDEITAQLEAYLGPESLDLVETLIRAKQFPRGLVLIVKQANRELENQTVVQAIWNLRDQWKNPRRMLILLGTEVDLPPELEHDVVRIDEPLPTAEELAQVAREVAAAFKLELSDKEAALLGAAALGLSRFGAEQLYSLNSSPDAISVEGVWQDKCHVINDTPGLRVVSTGSTFDSVYGVENVKQFLRSILTGRAAPNAIVFVDEIEKSVGGSSGDTSGVSQDQLGVLLQNMQDTKATGCIFVGPPGACKSALAKAAGGEAKIPTIQLDLGGMKASHVGQSEGRIRRALKIIEAVSGGRTLWLATCNSITSLPPELRRRFRYGTWFFDLPSYDERVGIWELYREAFALENVPSALFQQPLTGAEIESCCEIAANTGLGLEQAMTYIVPVARAAARQIEDLRAGADGKFLSASLPGTYTREGSATISGKIRDNG